MLRREFLAAAFAPRVDYRNYSRVLPDYLAVLSRAAYARRNLALSKLTNAEAVRERQTWARETFWKLSGGRLERTPLNTRKTGGFERDGYRVENLIYESRPGFHIPANLYIPKTAKPPYPGVLFQMGHTRNGKAGDLYQYCCQGLVQLGFLVLAFDPMGQGERIYYPASGKNDTRLRSADEEHTLPGKQLILTGDTSTRLQVWDAIRSLDLLASHPLVDPKRLASTGNSGGGTLTMLLIAADERLTCAAVASGNTENVACENFNSPGSTDDAEQDFLNSGPLGFDRWDTLYPMAPKPLLIVLSAKDFFGTYSPRYVENGREEFSKLQRVYETLGARDNVAWSESPLPHGLFYDHRMEIYEWFRRHMQGIATPLDKEPPVHAEPDATLYATPTGSVVRDLHGKTPWALVKENAAAIVTPAKPRDLPALLALDKLVAPNMAVKGEVRSARARIQAVEFESAAGVFLPAWLFTPLNAKSRGKLILLNPAGRNTHWLEDSLCQRLAETGLTVCAPDLRGIGDLKPEYPTGAPGHGRSHEEEEAYAFSSMILGKPLLGQRVADILAVAAGLKEGGKLRLAALGTMSVPALFAAYLDPGIEQLHVSGGLESFRKLVETEEYTEPFANFLFDMLRHVDLPQLRQAVAPKAVTWDLASLEAIYPIK